MGAEKLALLTIPLIKKPEILKHNLIQIHSTHKPTLCEVFYKKIQRCGECHIMVCPGNTQDYLKIEFECGSVV